MLTEQKEKAITLILSGEAIIDVAKLVGVARATIYNWLSEDDFKAELDSRRHDIVTQGNNLILSELNTYIKELKHIALHGKSEKIRSDTAQYLVDRVLGKPTTKVEQNDKDDDKDNVTDDILDKELNEVDHDSNE